MATDHPGIRRRLAAGAALSAMVLLTGAVLARQGASGEDEPAASTGPRVASVRPARVETGSAGRSGSSATQTAIAAASAPQQWLYLSDEEIRTAVLDIATPAAGPALVELTVSDLATARAELALSPGPVWWLVHPLATRVVALTATAAEVEVWTVSVLSAVEIASPQADWMTVTVDLVWGDDRWLVDSIRDRPGPSPALGPHDDAWDAAVFARALDGFERLPGSEVGEVSQ